MRCPTCGRVDNRERWCNFFSSIMGVGAVGLLLHSLAVLGIALWKHDLETWMVSWLFWLIPIYSGLIGVSLLEPNGKKD
jgi:FtsH-binding integral membrane protein